MLNSLTLRSPLRIASALAVCAASLGIAQIIAFASESSNPSEFARGMCVVEPSTTSCECAPNDSSTAPLHPLAIVTDGPSTDFLNGIVDDAHRARIFVRVENIDRSPWKGTCRNSASLANADHSWPRDPILVVMPVREDVDVMIPASRGFVGDALDDGEFVFDVPTNRHYLVGLIGGHQAWEPVEIEARADVGRREVSLVARDSPCGTISLSPYNSDGTVATHWSSVVKLEDPSRGTLLAIQDGPEEKTWPMRIELPEGEYRIAVEGLADTKNWHGVLRAPREQGRFETTVRVVCNSETHVDATLPLGSRVHLRLEGRANADDDRAVQREDLILVWPRDAASLASITLRSEGHWPEPVEFQYFMTETTAAGLHLRAQLPVGTDGTSELVSSGRFRLEARMPGGRVVSRDIVLVDGQTTEVTLRFE